MKTLLQYPGGKKRLASWIVSQMPEHHSYLEPYFGGGAVLFEKPAAPIETVNDLDGEVVNFFRVVRDEESRKKLVDWRRYTPYAREAYEESFKREPWDRIERAGYFAVRSMQSHGFRLNENCGWKKDVHGREAAYALHNWNRLPESLGEIAARLKQVQIENRPALELIKAFNHENVLIYADPPYVLSTRGRKQYPEKGSGGNKSGKIRVSSCGRKRRGYAGGSGVLPEECPDRGRLPDKGCPEGKRRA